jgi:predicted acetyltransferase
MGRVIDISQLGGMQVGPGAFSASVIDPVCPWNEGAWKFESEDGTLQVNPTEGSDCTLSIHGVSAMIYGTHDPRTFSLRGWGDPDTDTQERIRTMFPAQQPFMYEQF